MKKILTQVSKYAVGLLFLLSGFIKLNDPLGFSYKLEEYFGETVFNMPFLASLALPIALFFCFLEIILGIALLIHFKIKSTVYCLLVLIIFFSFLTFYSAYFDVVKDCGCFGDVLHLSPWQSFIKDIILLVLLLILLFNNQNLKPLFKVSIQKWVLTSSFVVCSILAYWVLNHLPFIDFRPYKIGTNIKQDMQVPPGAPKPIVEMVFMYNINGQIKEFTEEQLMELPENAVFIDRKDKVISQGFMPKIHDFKIVLNGIDLTEYYLGMPKLLVFTAHDLKTASEEGLNQIEQMANLQRRNGYEILGLTGASQAEIEAFEKTHFYSFRFAFCDATTIKTIERANPSIIYLESGVVKQKVHYKDIDKLKLD